MSRPVWFVQLLKRTFASRFLLARATKIPFVGSLLDRWLFDGDALIYLPRDSVIQINQPLDPPAGMVLPSQVVEHFIENARVHWIMETCICRDANQCEGYPVDLGCLFLGEAALGINSELGRRVTKAEALQHVERCREVGLVHLIGRNKLDTVWLGVDPGDKLLTVCNCCPCCCLWRVLPHMAQHMSAKVTRMRGVTVRVSDRCIGCTTCAQDVCFVDAIRIVDSRAVIGDECRGCGRCVTACPQQAIELFIDDGRFVEESIARIAPLVDVS